MKKSTKNRQVDGKVYCFTNKINGHKYVGTTFNALKIRIRTHFNLKYSGAPLLVKALKKYGKDNFTIKVIDTAKTIKDLGEKEIFWIKELNTKAPNGYNILTGGFTNEKAIEANRVPVKCITNGAIFQSLVDASKKTGIGAYLIGFNCVGRQDTAGGMEFEYLDKNKRKRALKAKQKRKNKILKSKTKIRNVKTGEIYLGFLDAHRKTGISKGTIHHCATGTMHEYKGARFEFVDPEKKKKAKKLSASIKRKKGNKYV